jgi:hypothetical protein
MSRINEKLGLRPAGRRAMMKGLPTTPAERSRLTSARCPSCGRTGALPSTLKGAGWGYCGHCNCTFSLPERPA